MKVEIVHTRLSDENCTVEVFIDGVRVKDEHVELIDVDPGRGYLCTDLIASCSEAMAGASDEAKQAIAASYEDALGDEYTEHQRDDNGRCVICDDEVPS